ncbi:MAG: type II toxin-antitoxin system HicB family antitoxin [Deltaproteobacteria bacterium]|nr:type II toxin-antitoxin system HicB family antitoxin [Deltaproteobacteria bacterium]
MDTRKFVYYRDEDMFVGWLEEFPDYRTQGANLEELKENLKDIFDDLQHDHIPNVRHVGELVVG